MSRYIISRCDRCGKDTYNSHTNCDGVYHDGDGVYNPLPEGWRIITPMHNVAKLLCPDCFQEWLENYERFW